MNFGKFLLNQHLFVFLILNISSDPYKTYYFLKEHDEVP